MIIAGFAERSHAWQAMNTINAFKEGPASVDFMDESLLENIKLINPALLSPLEGGMPATLLFFELDNETSRVRKKIEKKLIKALENAGAEIVIPKESEVEPWERLRDGASIYLTHSLGKKQALPVMDDAQVPLNRMVEFFNELDGLMQTASLPEYAVWGQAGTGLVHVSPLLDISSVGDRQKLFKLMDAYYGYICSIGGSISGEYAEGRMRGMFNSRLFDQTSMEVFAKIKKIFDPAGIMNPGVKLDVKLDEIKSMVRSEYSLDHQYNHLPRG